MRKYWYRRILIMIVTFLIAVAGGYYLIEFQQNRLEAEVNAATSSENMVIPGGMPIGIYLETEGVMVLGTDSITAEDGLRTGSEPGEGRRLYRRPQRTGDP